MLSLTHDGEEVMNYLVCSLHQVMLWRKIGGRYCLSLNIQVYYHIDQFATEKNRSEK